MIAYPLRQYKDLFTFLLMGVFFSAKKRAARAVVQILLLSSRPEPSDMIPQF